MHRRVVSSARAAASGLARHLSAAGPPAPTADPRLGVCIACRRDFVDPIEWDAVGDDRWWMLLRCGECGVTREVTVADADAQRFDIELDDRASLIASAADRLDLDRMAAEAATLIAALERDLIDAADFAR
jgi:hypothetical protein